MTVNGVDILTTYKAKLLNKQIHPSEIIIYDDWLRNSLSPVYLGKQEKFKKIAIQLLIVDNTDNLCLKHVSNLISLFRVCTIKFDDVDFYFSCSLSNSECSRLIVEGHYVLRLEFKAAYGYYAYVTEELENESSITFTVQGNVAAPAIVTVTPAANQAELTISGFVMPIKLKNLLANTPVIIDGAACTVLQNGSNKFNDTEMWAFPALLPGAVTIATTISACVIQIKYQPKFL